MAKAINWPGSFRDEVIGESTEKLCCAFRLGRLYYDNQYWVDGEVIDIRVNHIIIRKALIVGEMKCCPISDLTPEDFDCQKSSIQSQEAVVQFLATTYDQLVTPDMEISIVYYRNQPLDPAVLEVPDDPHEQA